MHRCVIIAVLIELLIYVSSICILTNGCNISQRLGTDAGVPGMTLLMNDFIDRTPSESNYVNPRAPQYIWRTCLAWIMFNRKSNKVNVCLLFSRCDSRAVFTVKHLYLCGYCILSFSLNALQEKSIHTCFKRMQ